MKLHTGAGKSFNSSVTCQSSTMAHNCSTGPSMNACSASERAGFSTEKSLFQSGFPENNSASHHTVPASMASLSVCETGGMDFFTRSNSGAVRYFLRNAGA